MQSTLDGMWQHPDWPRFHWDEARLAPLLSRARLAQGKVLDATRLLDPQFTLEAVAVILAEDAQTISAIEGERLDPDAVRSSVARHLGLPTAGLPAPTRAVDGLIEVLLDATRRHDGSLTAKRLFVWQAAPTREMSAGLGVVARSACSTGFLGTLCHLSSAAK